MKISEMTNDQACEAITRISGPLANLCEDPEVKAIFDDIENMGKDGESSLAAVTKVLPRIVAFGLKTHKQDVYEIAGALTSTPASRFGSLNFMQTVKEIRESWDEVIAGFFTSSVAQTKQTTDE